MDLTSTPPFPDPHDRPYCSSNLLFAAKRTFLNSVIVPWHFSFDIIVCTNRPILTWISAGLLARAASPHQHGGLHHHIRLPRGELPVRRTSVPICANAATHCSVSIADFNVVHTASTLLPDQPLRLSTEVLSHVVVLLPYCSLATPYPDIAQP